jgi:hypothetical protein
LETLTIKNCNYGSIILNKNVYSYGLLNDLNARIKPNNNSYNSTICFNTILEIDEDTDDVIKNKLKQLLDLYSADEDVTIIYLGYSQNLKPIVNILNFLQSSSYSYLNKITVITSEAAINDFRNVNLYTTISLYSIQFETIKIIDNTNLIIYYSNIIDSLINGVNNSLSMIPWLTEFVMITLNCTPNHTSSIEFLQNQNINNLHFCNLIDLARTKLSLLDSQYLRYLIYSFAALSSKLNETLKACMNCYGFLTDESMTNLIRSLRNQIFDFTANKKIPYNIRGNFRMINGMFYSDSLNLYDLFDFSSYRTVSLI